MNNELEILKEIQIGTIRGKDNEFIYASQMDNNNNKITTDIQVLDWSLEITKTIHLQDQNPQQKFFIQNLLFQYLYYIVAKILNLFRLHFNNQISIIFI
jgi:hypothetical protein